MLFDGQGLCLTTNRTGITLMGCSSEELAGKQFLELWPEDVRPAAEDCLNGVLGGRLCGFDAWLPRGNEERWWSILLSPIRDRTGSVERFIAIGSDITDRKRADERKTRHLEKMQALCAVNTAITGNLDLDSTLNTILEKVVEQLGVDAANVLLLEPSTATLSYAASRGFRTDQIREVSMRVGRGFAGKAVLDRKQVVINDFSTYRGSFDLAGSFLSREEGFRAYLCVPLIAKGVVNGVLEIFNRHPFSPGSEWMAFLDTLAGQAAVALASATMFAEVESSREELLIAYDTTIEGWARALDFRDKETEGHSRRVTDLTVRLAKEMGIRDERLTHIRRGALLHDIGKLGVPDSILLKNGPLTDMEWGQMKRHPQIAYEILAPIPFLRNSLDIPHCHHERWDGTGYPYGLKGEQIPLAARIFALIDIWDAVQSERPYRSSWAEDDALEHIASLAGTHLDPQVVETFLRMQQRSPSLPR